MKRRMLLAASLALAMGTAMAAAPEKVVVEVWRSATCGCCKAWIRHLQEAGFTTKENLVENTAPMRKALGIAPEHGSCHTARVAGYAIEGHVPAADIRKLLAQKPAAIGLAAPGMPAGSPGMEVPGKADPYDVLLVERSGGTRVFARH